MRRIISVGSFIIATRPLTDAEVAATLPGDRTCVTSMNIGNYFRLSPDRRLIFGGRARFSARSDQTSDAKSGTILRRSMAASFPHLADVPVRLLSTGQRRRAGLAGVAAPRRLV